MLTSTQWQARPAMSYADESNGCLWSPYGPSACKGLLRLMNGINDKFSMHSSMLHNDAAVAAEIQRSYYWRACQVHEFSVGAST